MAPVADPAQTFGLGYRGVIARVVKTTTAIVEGRFRSTPKYQAGSPRAGRLPIEFRLGSQPVGGDSVQGWFLELSERKVDIPNEVREVLHEGITTVPSTEEAPPEGEFQAEEGKGRMWLRAAPLGGLAIRPTIWPTPRHSTGRRMWAAITPIVLRRITSLTFVLRCPEGEAGGRRCRRRGGAGM